jgi:putative SOS response-associated peptidase YedK
MCYNVAVKLTTEQIAEAFGLTNASAWLGPRDRITIGQNLPVVVQTDDDRSLEMMFWGFTPAWMKDPKGGLKPGNARAETVSSTPMFRDAFKSRRGIVPVTAYFEWQGEKGAKELLPFYVPQMPIFSFPAIYETWTMPDGTKRTSCATITSEPNDDTRGFHDRMPVIFDKNAEAVWLSPTAKKDDLLQLLAPAPLGLVLPDPDGAYKPAR